MSEYGTKSVLCVDNGLFVECAISLSKSYGKVYYWSPWANSFPKSNAMLIGKGVPGIERVDDIWDVVDDVDLFAFFDVYYGGLQLHLQEMGKRVWGSRKGEELELCRRETKEYLKKIDIPIGNYKTITGLSNLRDHLKSHENQWVKISLTRGDMESFHSKNYKNIEPRLDELEHSLGAKKAIMEFIVEDGIDDAVEVAYDGYTVDGQFPTFSAIGIEVKDKGYLGFFLHESKWPKQIIELNSKIAPTLAKYQYRNFFGMEARITKDGTPWVVDPLCRYGSPPMELLQVMYTNLDDILWKGAEGICVDPVPAARYGAELLIHSSWADTHWQAVELDPKDREFVKLRNLTVIEDNLYVVPQAVGLPEIGAVVAVGDTMEEAIETVRERAKRVHGYFIDVFPESLDEAEVELEKLKEYGIRLR